MSRPKKEPIKNGKLWIVFGFIFLLSFPWYLPTGSYKPVILGMPYWVWIVLFVSIALSSFLTYAIKYQWHLEDDETNVKEEE